MTVIYRENEVKYIICETCGGSGIDIKPVGLCGFKEVTCPDCGGSRVIKKTTEVTLEKVERAQAEKPESEGDNDKIAEGMKAIKEYCKAQPCCEDCRLAIKGRDCKLQYYLPCRWETDK